MKGARDQGIRSAAEEGQVARVATKAGAVEVASEWEGEIGNTQRSSSAESEAGVAGGNEIAREGERAEGEGEGGAAVEGGNLIDRMGIRRASDKTVVGAHGGQVPLEGFPGEDGCEKTDCTRMGRGSHVEVEMEVGVGRMDVRRDMRLGRYSRSERGGSEAKKVDHGEANMRIYAEKLDQESNLRVGNVWEVCLSMSSQNEGVCGIDEARHADLVQRLGGVMEASVVAAADVWSPGHMDMGRAWTVIGGVAADAGTGTADVGVVAENGVFDGRRKELRPRSNWTDSNRAGWVGKREKRTQRKQM